MEIRESDLPGVGKKYMLETQVGDRLAVIVHTTGRREIYKTPSGDDVPVLVAELTDAEARSLGAVLGGLFFQPRHVDSMYVLMKELVIDWLRLGARSSLIGHTIREREVRKRTGVSIIAILREGQSIPNPSPDEVLREGDTLLVVGRHDQLDELRRLI